MDEQSKWLAFIGDISEHKHATLTDSDKLAVIKLAVRYGLNRQLVTPREPGPTLPEVVARVERLERRVDGLAMDIAARDLPLHSDDAQPVAVAPPPVETPPAVEPPVDPASPGTDEEIPF